MKCVQELDMVENKLCIHNSIYWYDENIFTFSFRWHFKHCVDYKVKRIMAFINKDCSAYYKYCHILFLQSKHNEGPMQIFQSVYHFIKITKYIIATSISRRIIHYKRLDILSSGWFIIGYFDYISTRVKNLFEFIINKLQLKPFKRLQSIWRHPLHHFQNIQLDLPRFRWSPVLGIVWWYLFKESMNGSGRGTIIIIYHGA